MEDYLIIVSITLIGFFSLVALKMFKPGVKVKSGTNKAKDVLSKVTDETIERLSLELRKATGRANRLQALRNDEEEELGEEDEPIEGKQVTWEEITTLVKTQYPKQAALLPLLKKQIMEATEGMSMEEVMNYVKQFTGNKQSEGTLNLQSVAYNPDWA